MLNEHDSHALYNQLSSHADLVHALDIIQRTGAKFGVDGDQYYYGFGELPERTGVYGFGKTPSEAAWKFQQAYYSQIVKTKQ